MKANLDELLPAALAGNYAVPCFNVFGYEDAHAIVDAAEAASAPVILATNKDMVDFMGVRTLSGMLSTLAEESSVPVCLHLDHCYEEDIVRAAVDAGYASVMFDGSQLPVQENIERSGRVVEYAHRFGVTVEGEVGSVPYASGRDHIRSELTNVAEARQFSEQSGVDAVAVSCGNVHRLESAVSRIDYELLDSLEQAIAQPLVIHGASGIAAEDLARLATRRVCKFNIGTTLRQAFGRSMRETLTAQPELYDRLTLFREVMPAVSAAATEQLRRLGAAGQVTGI